MPTIRSYPQALTLDATDAFLIDRIGSGSLYVEASAVGGGSSSWSALTGIPTNINTLATGGTPSAGQIFQWSSATTGSFIATPAFIQNFSYAALTGLPNAVAALTTLTPAAGQIVEYTGAGTAHMIATPSGGGGGVTTPGTTHTGSLVTWNSLTGAAIADPNVIPSSNGYSLISSANYASMRGLLGIGAVGLLGDLSTVAIAGANVTITTVAGVSTFAASLNGGITTSTYIGSSNTVSASVSSSIIVSVPAGANTGDFAVFTAYSQTAFPTVPAGGITVLSNTVGFGKIVIFGKLLTSSDITVGNITVTGYGSGAGRLSVSVYRGPNNISLGQSKLSAATTGDNLSGFVKSPNNIGTIAILLGVADPFTGDGYGTLSTTPGSPFSNVYNNSDTSNSFTVLAVNNALSASPYINSTSIAWTWTTGTLSYGIQPELVAVELRNDGTSGGGGSAVTSVNTRVGAVSLTAPDVLTGFGLQMNGLLAAGSGASLSYNSGTGVTTISATGTSGVSTFNGRSGAVSFVAGDVFPVLSAGSGISLSNLGSTVQITASGAGSVPISYYGAAENSILTSNSASTNTTNLNNLITTVNAAGGGKIWFNGPGAYSFNGTITLKSNVDIWMVDGAYINWTGSAGGTIFQSDINNVMYATDLTINVNEGSAFTGIVFNIHSCQNCKFDFVGLGIQTAAGAFVYLHADSTGGVSPYAGLAANRNTGLNIFRFRHYGEVGLGLDIQGITTGYAGGPQGVTDNTFYDIYFSNVLFRGIRLNQWADSNTFSGNTYIGLIAANANGIIANEGRVNNFTVYNTVWQHVQVDIFNNQGGRTGVVFQESEGMTINEMFIGPTLEAGDFIGTNCTSYNCQKLVNSGSFVTGGGVNTIYVHQKAVTVGP